MISFRACKIYACLLVFLVTLMIFSPVMLNEFLNWDDHVFVVDNVQIDSLSWRSLHWMLTSFSEGMWLPLTWFSHAVDRALWGLDPGYHHLTNAIIHAASALLVFALFLELIRGREISEEGRYVAALAGALLFALHPLRVESVAWVSERKGVLYSLFFLSSMIFYLKYARGGSTWKAYTHYATSLLLCLAALLSKSMAVSLPVVLLLLDYYPLERLKPALWRRAVLEKVPFLILSAGAMSLNMMAFRWAAEPAAHIPVQMRIMSAFYGLAFYLKQTLFPENLLPLYQLDYGMNYFGATFILSAFLIVGLTVGCLWLAFKGDRFWAAVWFYYLITIAPPMSLFLYNRYGIQDRYTYLPTLGLWLLVGLGVGRLWDMAKPFPYSREARAALVGGVVVLALLYGHKTVQQMPIWRNSGMLWTHVLTHSTHSPHPALFGLGLELEKKGQFDQALGLYERALKLSPKEPRYVAQVANVLAAKGDPQRALGIYTDLATEYPRSATFQFHRGRMFALMGRDDEALAAFDRALEMAPRETKAGFLRVLVQAAMKDAALANEFYRRYISEGYAPDPDFERQLGIESGRRGMPK